MIGEVLLSVPQPYADRPPVLDEDPLHPGAVADVPAEPRVPLLHRPGQTQRTALGEARVAVEGAGHREEEGEQGEAGQLLEEHVRERLAQQRVLEAVREPAHRRGRGAPVQPERRQDREQRSRLLRQGLERRRLQLPVRGDPSEAPEIPAERPDQALVAGRELQQVLLEPVRVVVERDGPAVLRHHPVELVEQGDPLPVQRPELPPHVVRPGPGGRADQPVDAVVEEVALSSPGGAAAPRQHVLLEDPALQPTHLRVAAGGQTRHARADDDHPGPPAGRPGLPTGSAVTHAHGWHLPPAAPGPAPRSRRGTSRRASRRAARAPRVRCTRRR